MYKRQALHWNCAQLAVSLRLLADSEPLLAALNRYGELYMQAIARRWCWRLGVEPRGNEEDSALVTASEKHMRDNSMGPDAFFFAHRGGREARGELADALAPYRAVDYDHDYWSCEKPQTMLIEEVEEIWAAIDERDDWSLFDSKIAAIRDMGVAHGQAPIPAGHT